MELEGDDPVTSPDEFKFSTPHIVEGEELQLQFPLEGFPYSEGIPASFPPDYVSLGHLVLSTTSASSLYHNPVWASGVRLMSGPFVMNTTSQQAVTSILVQPTILNALVSLIQVTFQSQPAVSRSSLSVLLSH